MYEYICEICEYISILPLYNKLLILLHDLIKKPLGMIYMAYTMVNPSKTKLTVFLQSIDSLIS